MFSNISKKQYIMVGQIVAILRLANAMDRSHHQKVIDVKTSMRDDQLIISANVDENYILERGLIGKELEFFRDVFNVTPVLSIKRKL